MFRVLGPDAPWVTAEIVSLLENGAKPFEDRFVWPDPPVNSLDSKTRLPTCAHFCDVAELFSAVDVLGSASGGNKLEKFAQLIRLGGRLTLPLG